GLFLSSFDYQKAQRIRQDMKLSWLNAIADADVILTPTLIAEPPPHRTSTVQIDGKEFPLHTAFTRCTMPFNLTGMPAITLPISSTRYRWPVSIQLVAAHGDDAALINAARQVEQIIA